MYGGPSPYRRIFLFRDDPRTRKGLIVMKKHFTITRKRMVMAIIIATLPTTVFAAQSGGGSAVKYILYAGVAAAFIIDMWHESKRRK